MKTKTKNFIIIALCVLPIILLVAWASVCIVHDINQPTHKVEIKYIVYRDGTPYPNTKTYTMKGTSFVTSKYTERQKYGHGPNILEIKDADAWWCYVGDQVVCVYSGYNDVDVLSLKVIE